GSWGTALAVLLAGNGHDVTLWGRNEQQMAEMQNARYNQRYLPETRFPDSLTASSDIHHTVSKADEVLLVVPSAAISQIIDSIKPSLNNKTKLAIASKGFEPNHLKLLHEVVQEKLGPQSVSCIISGPTFAKEVAKGLPTAMTVASKDQDFARDFAGYLSNDHFRAYTSTDVIGVEVGGAIKNVMAIAAGISDGLGFGANSRAALITRGLAEITRLGTFLGGKTETFMGLAGLGDLVLTCTDNQSRNRRVGLALAQGKALDDILKELGQVAEGVFTTQKVFQLSQKHNIEMPIAEQVYEVIYNNKSPKLAVADLLQREIKSEI
ncbi:MAG: NAD(P)H-dependent glycerol-3-phosphate dehydrogenase, partial [Gammaproteobacteria bacterium]|nr:NAD(P)H-dependent glycerol-3-phosphate dehydrogenase [Gammaproteobacteria bacterium]